MRNIIGFGTVVIGHLLLVLNSIAYEWINGLLYIQRTHFQIFVYLISSAFCFVGIVLLSRQMFHKKHFWVTCVIVAMFMIFMMPGLSDDIYRYLWDGIVTVNGDSPYEYLPREKIVHQGLYSSLNSSEYYSVYPPVSQIFFYLSALLSNKSIYLQFVIYKILCVICFLVSIHCLLQIMDLLKIAQQKIYLVALNPIATTELIGQGHSEVFMICFLILSLLSYYRNYTGATVFFLSLATWVKLYPILFLALLFTRKRTWCYAWIPPLTTMLLFIPFYCPDMITHIRSSLDLYTKVFSFNSALFVWGQEWLDAWGYSNVYQQSLKMCWRVFLVAYILAFVWRIWLDYVDLLIYTMFFYLVLNAAVHPWYITPLLFLCILKPKSHTLIWWSLLIIPTYLFYNAISSDYWQKMYITCEYIGVTLLFLPCLLSFVMKFLAWRKYHLCKKYIYGSRILDNGCGEGYLGEYCAQNLNVNVHNLDVIPLHQSKLPFTLYDGKNIPFPDNSFDITICALMLHHCNDSEQVLKETVRVTSKRIIILESTFENMFDLKVLTFLDRIANFVRSGGRMGKEPLHFRSPQQWEKTFEKHSLKITQQFWANRFIHKHIVFVLDILY